MKNRFTTFDVSAIIHDLQSVRGMRVINIYDINSKTYIIKLQRPNEKAFILFESGIRIHLTTYDWPKSIIPSGFSMKFRKHIRSKRLTNATQLGTDRIIDLQFGDDERAHHIIVELYDRGNVVLTDHEYMIMNILRPRTDADSDVRFSVRERYPVEKAQKHDNFLPTLENVYLFLENSKDGDQLRKSLVKHVPLWSAILDHGLATVGLSPRSKIGVDVKKNSDDDASRLLKALQESANVSASILKEPFGGFIAFVSSQQQSTNFEDTAGTLSFDVYKEYYPYDFAQYQNHGSGLSVRQFQTFSEAVDMFYSSMEAQKSEQRVAAVENEANQRVNNIRKDHEHRLEALGDLQIEKERRAEYIQYNRELVDHAILLLRSALANKMDWEHQIPSWLDQVRICGVPDAERAARSITQLRLDSNIIVMKLENLYEPHDPPISVEVDLALSSDQNIRKYYDDRRLAAQKQVKTEAAKSRALKSAREFAQLRVDQARARQRQQNIVRARKTYWFERFLWFISSDGFLVIGGKDAQENEQLVKRYMRPGDIFVHAEIQGAATVIVRNRLPAKQQTIVGEDGDEQPSSKNDPHPLPPPRTLNEAGTLAICFSSAWGAGVIVNAYWVHHDQVSKTAQPGEFVAAGGFIIRGKRNFLPTCQLQLGFGLMFRLDDESVDRHRLLHKKQLDEQASIEGITDNGHILEKLNQKNIVTELNDYDELNESVQQLHEPISDSIADAQNEASTSSDGETENEDEDLTAFPDIQLKLDNLCIKPSEKEDDDYLDVEENVAETGSADEGPDNDEGDEDGPGAGISGEDTSLIEQLTSIPFPDDAILFSLAVCAPYTAMQQFKFKVKITPGTNKRGKATKQALSLFLRDKTISLAERTLIKGLTMDESRLSQNLPPRVRVSAPALVAALTSEHHQQRSSACKAANQKQKGKQTATSSKQSKQQHAKSGAKKLKKK